MRVEADEAQRRRRVRSERNESLVRLHRADADRARRVVAAAAGDAQARAKSPTIGESRAQLPRDVAAFDQPGHLGARQMASRKKLVGPASLSDVEQDGAMHLPGRSDRTHAGHSDRMRRAHPQHRRIQGHPPVGRILFDPVRLRKRRDDGLADAGDEAVPLEERQLQLGGAEVDAEIHVGHEGVKGRGRNGGRPAGEIPKASCP